MNFHLKSVCAEWIFYVPMLECSVTVVTMLLINKIQYCKIQSVCCFARLHHANNIKVCYSYPITRSFCSTTIWNLERSRCSSTYQSLLHNRHAPLKNSSTTGCSSFPTTVSSWSLYGSSCCPLSLQLSSSLHCYCHYSMNCTPPFFVPSVCASVSKLHVTQMSR